jgi:hypothetical protein
MPRPAILLLLALAAGCASSESMSESYSGSGSSYRMRGVPDNTLTAASAPVPLDPTRTVAERDCSKPLPPGGGNLRCQ